MTTGNKVAPTSTAWQARVILYQPSQRPEEVKGQWMETSFRTLSCYRTARTASCRYRRDNIICCRATS